MQSADVVVVGGGIVGLSIAYQLARRDAGRVVVIERNADVGEGSTGASSAVLRQRYTHSQVVRLARDGLAVFRNWGDFTGVAEPRATFNPIGVLWMGAEPPDQVEQERGRLAEEGVVTSLLSAADVRQRFPSISTCGTLYVPGAPHECADHDAYLFEDEGGYFDPSAASHDLLEAARREGVEVLLRTAVTDVETRGGRVAAVVLDGETRLPAGTVVNAAGPWCGRVHDMVGHRSPWTLRPTRIQIVYRARSADVPGPLPVVGDLTGGIYFRPESGGQQILIGSVRGQDEQEAVEDPDVFKNTDDPEFRARLLDALHHRLPGLPHRGEVTGIAGLYTVNVEDVHPVVGPTDVEGYVVANGFSGHGFKLAPMIGAMIARWMTGRTAPHDTDVPMEFLSVDRRPLVVAEKSVLA